MTSGRFYNLIFLKVVAVPCKRVAYLVKGLLKIQHFEENLKMTGGNSIAK